MELYLFILPGFVTYLFILSERNDFPTVDYNQFILVPILTIYSLLSLAPALLVSYGSIPFYKSSTLCIFSFLSRTLIKTKYLGELNPLGISVGLFFTWILKNFTWPVRMIAQKKNIDIFIKEIYDSGSLCMLRTKQSRIYIGNISKRENQRNSEEFIFITPVMSGNYNNGVEITTSYVVVKDNQLIKHENTSAIETGIASSEIVSVTNFNPEAFIDFYLNKSVCISNKELEKYYAQFKEDESV